MNGFFQTWSLIRGRFDAEVSGLSAQQLNWRLQPGTLTIGESAIHVAGVETSFISQLMQMDLDPETIRVKRSAVAGVIDDEPFPFTAAEITPGLVKRILDQSRALTSPIIESPPAEIYDRQIKSALGPMIDADGAFSRLAYHPGYHQGQVYLVKQAPGYPVG